MTLCCWSGGCDSTLAVWLCGRNYRASYKSALLHAKAAANGADDEKAVANKPLRLLSMVHPQVAAPLESARARRELLKRFRRLGLPVSHTTVTLSHRGSFCADRGSGLAQPLLWLGTAVSYLLEDEDLVLGYIAGDQIWHYRHELLAAFAGPQGVGGRSGRLSLPLEWSSKADVIAQLKKVGLYSPCWYCETPVVGRGGRRRDSGRREHGRPCGTCRPCVMHRTALWQLGSGLAGGGVAEAIAASAGGRS